MYNEILASRFYYKAPRENGSNSIRSYRLSLDGNKLKKEIIFNGDKQKINVYHQLNSIYCWDTTNKKFIKSNLGWVDDYLRLLRTNKATSRSLRLVFEEYFKKKKGQSTVIYHEDHKNSLTAAERKNAAFEVRAGVYINVVGSTYVYLPKSRLSSKLRLNFMGASINACSLRIMNLQLNKHLNFVKQMNRDFDCKFNLHTLYVFLVDKTSLPDGKYWMDSNCYEIDPKLKLSKKIYYDGPKKYENRNIVNFNSEKNIQIDDLGDAKKLNSSLDNIKRLIQESEKVEKTLGISQEGYFFYDDSNVIRETFISEINKKVPLIGSISYFDKVNSDDKIKLITPKNRLKFEVRGSLLLEELAFQLQPTLGNKKINLRKRDIDNFNILIIPKKSIGQKRKNG